MSRADHSLRLFVAAYPPRSVIDGAVEAMSRLELPPHRLTPAEQVHITLQFIGEVSQRELDEVTETVQSAVNGVEAFTLMPQRLISLPHRGPSRLIAIETDAPPSLIELHRRLAQRLSRAARLNPADRFLPHFTLCRFNNPTRMPAVDQPLAIEPFPVGAVQLMRSTLTHAGAMHQTLATMPLVE
jgi:2'-5' RNA ligase